LSAMDIIPDVARHNSKRSKDFFKLGKIQAELTQKKKEVEQNISLSVLQQAMMMDTANKLKDVLAEVQRKMTGLELSQIDAASSLNPQQQALSGDPLAGQLPMGSMDSLMGGGGGMPPGGGGMPSPEMMPPGGGMPSGGGGMPPAAELF